MERHFRITVNGKSYDVRVEELGEAHAGHAAHPHPAPHVHAAAASAPVAAATATATPHAHADAGPGDVVAPLGGVVAWVAPVGQSVREGERVATLEAMKMQTPVVATQAGTVARVLVKEGDAVEAGQPLVTLG